MKDLEKARAWFLQRSEGVGASEIEYLAAYGAHCAREAEQERDEATGAFDRLVGMLEVETEYSNLRGYEEILEDCQVAIDNGVGKTWHADHYLPLQAERDALAAQVGELRAALVEVSFWCHYDLRLSEPDDDRDALRSRIQTVAEWLAQPTTPRVQLDRAQAERLAVQVAAMREALEELIQQINIADNDCEGELFGECRPELAEAYRNGKSALNAPIEPLEARYRAAVALADKHIEVWGEPHVNADRCELLAVAYRKAKETKS